MGETKTAAPRSVRQWIRDGSALGVHVETSVDEPEKAERYIAVASPFWLNLKSDIKTAVVEYNAQRICVPYLSRTAAPRVLLRGDAHGLDVTFRVEKECLFGRYMRFLWKPSRRPRVVTVRLDMRPEGLVPLDCAGCPIEEPVRFCLEPLFRRWRATGGKLAGRVCNA